MKKAKEKVELRYYDVPQNDFMLALQGLEWKRQYGSKDSPLHFHNLMEIGVCRYGSGIMKMENEDMPYQAGTISVLPVNYPHNTLSTEDTESYWEYLFVDSEKILQAMYPDDLLFQQKMMEKINKRPYLGNEKAVPELAGIVHTILDETRNKQDPLYRECIRGLSLALLINVARLNAVSSAMPEGGIRLKTGFDQIRPALDHIREQYSSPMKISEIAAVCHVSESHFRRLFEENIGMTPVEYLNQIRIRKACDLIKTTGSSMEEIAVKVGFATTSTFNRNFKRITGTSPYQWKKQPENFESRLSRCNIMVEKGW
ncbi:MAG: AraC family transcriptional regulator [Lachnospiraceae bacterium]|nr:AraC family transcriptional regulator [Lachnospiraceae bacterium]